jgi:uncharacterized protein (DUF2384 family)
VQPALIGAAFSKILDLDRGAPQNSALHRATMDPRKNCENLKSMYRFARAIRLRKTSSKGKAKGLSDLTGRIILASMSALLSSVQDGKIWRVKIVWPNRAVHHFGKFTSEREAIDWINAHPRLTRPEDTMDDPQKAELREQAAAAFLAWREGQKAKDK